MDREEKSAHEKRVLETRLHVKLSTIQYNTRIVRFDRPSQVRCIFVSSQFGGPSNNIHVRRNYSLTLRIGSACRQESGSHISRVHINVKLQMLDVICRRIVHLKGGIESARCVSREFSNYFISIFFSGIEGPEGKSRLRNASRRGGARASDENKVSS